MRERSSEQESCKIRGIERGEECTRVKKEDKELQREHKREDECSRKIARRRERRPVWEGKGVKRGFEREGKDRE